MATHSLLQLNRLGGWHALYTLSMYLSIVEEDDHHSYEHSNTAHWQEVRLSCVLIKVASWAFYEWTLYSTGAVCTIMCHSVQCTREGNNYVSSFAVQTSSLLQYMITNALFLPSFQGHNAPGGGGCTVSSFTYCVLHDRSGTATYMNMWLVVTSEPHQIHWHFSSTLCFPQSHHTSFSLQAENRAGDAAGREEEATTWGDTVSSFTRCVYHDRRGTAIPLTACTTVLTYSTHVHVYTSQQALPQPIFPTVAE